MTDDIVIPLPDTSGYFHFLYCSTDPTTGFWYSGKRSTKKYPLKDTYRGSGNWVRRHPNPERLKREIIAFYPSSAEVYAAEAEMITWATVMEDPLCMNLWAGGRGITAEAAIHRGENTDWRKNNLAGITLRSENPKWIANQLVGAAKRLADPAYHEANKAGGRIRANDPKWIANQSAAMSALHADPAFQEKRSAGFAKWLVDPRRPAVIAAAIEARSANPEWSENQAKVIRRVMEASTWKAAQLAGAQKLAVVFVTLNGKRMSVADACRETGISYKLVLGRRKQGWPESEWLIPATRSKVDPKNARAAVPAGRRENIFVTLNGKRVPLREACLQVGVPYPTAHDRLQRGWPESEWLIPSRKKRLERPDVLTGPGRHPVRDAPLGG